MSFNKQKDIYEIAKEWLRLDKNPETREVIEQLCVKKDESMLETLLRNPISFGTAGLRAKMEAGFSRMNDLTIIQASQGLCRYVLEKIPNATNKGIVIGYDHRYNSERFAKLTAAAFIHKKFKVYLYKSLVHTPMVPYGIQHFKAACGVMITASHNPKQDNGYKVYWSNGCQIVEPHDAGISKHISLNQEPWTWDVSLCDSSFCSNPYDALSESYFKKISSLVSSDILKNFEPQSLPKFVYTPLHGVGGPVALKAFESIKYPSDNIFSVPQQFKCDPDFPTVKFPNPEEKGALNLAISYAEEIGANIILANDPDADRFAASEKQPDGRWHQFTGNQLGSLLAYQVWMKHRNNGSKIGMLASAVSSKMLQSMGKIEGFHFEETLTGFKWLGNRAIQLKEQENIDIIFAYEEAIGFMSENIVKDKDGVSAMLIFAELATQLKSRSCSIFQFLIELYKKYGIFVESNSYFISNDPAVTEKLFNQIRYGQVGGSTLSFPEKIGSYRVTRIRDLTIGYDNGSTLPNNIPELPVSASSQMITFKLEDDNGLTIDLTLRTSGTEPKIKYYSELHKASSSESNISTDHIEKEIHKLRAYLQNAVKDILEVLLCPSKYNLIAA